MADMSSKQSHSDDNSVPHALQVVVTEDDHTFTLKIDNLERLLLDPRVKNNKVIVISVAGAFRKGKSFLLDFFLRYLYAKGSDNWTGSAHEPLKGFPWKGGSERQTSGILMWSEPFEVTLRTGEKACVLLMDTQGAFDSQSTVRDCATVFALSTMLSSVLIYNIMGNIQEDDLQHLQLFTEYGRLAMEGTKTKPFQDLHFLVRDWPYAYQHEYGSAGGAEILDRRLQIVDGQHTELQQLRRHLKACFSKIGCYLMPHPGLKVATNPQFDGRLTDIEEDFQVHIKNFVDALLNTDSLVVKEINGSEITGKELVEYFKVYMALYQGDELPEPKSMLQATAEANNLAAIANAKDLYTREMEQICGGDKAYMGPELLLAEHTRCKEKAVAHFNGARKMGGVEFSEAYAYRLSIALECLYDNYVKHNAAKNVFKGLQTPATLFCIVVVSYVISGLLDMLGLETFSNFFTILVLAICCVAAVWVYTRATGNYAEVGATIDGIAGTVHKLTIDRIVGGHQPAVVLEEKKKL